MADIEFYDGTTSRKYHRALERVLQELSKYQRVLINPSIKFKDVSRIKQVIDKADRAYKPFREQIVFESFILFFSSFDDVQKNKEKQYLILTDKDMYERDSAYTYGKHMIQGGVDFLALSTFRMQSESHFFYVLSHEIGKMYGAAYKGRKNSNHTDNFKNACTNRPCAMNCEVEWREQMGLARILLEKNEIFCPDCQDDLKTIRI